MADPAICPECQTEVLVCEHLRAVPSQPETTLRDLLSEVDCRIEHGAESGGHLEYVRDKLRGLLT